MSTKLYKRIMVATDLTDESTNVIRKAIQIAKLTDAYLVLVHVNTTGSLAESNVFTNSANLDFSLISDNLSDIALANLNSYKFIADELSLKYFEMEVLSTSSSNVAHTITDVLAPKYDIDLIVCGSSNSRRLYKYILGSVSNTILKTAKSDVLVVKDQ